MKENNKEYLDHLRHSAAHLLAAAVMELYPDTKRTIGPAIENGFYFDFQFSKPISSEDLPKIEEKMREIGKTWKSFEREEVPADEGKKRYKDNPFKIELIEEFAKEGQTLTFYKSGNYEDLCRGGHIEDPESELKHFKLLSVAGAYWRGSEKNPMLTRIYGTAFPTKDELEHHLWQLEEAKKRDHRKLGQELELFTFADEIGPGLVLWLPKGTVIRDEIEKLGKEYERKEGYKRVSTPLIAKKVLFEISGHLPYYKDSMYPPMKLDDGEYYLKAMNCPATHMIYKFRPRSYRELPLRLAEFGTVHRYELSGTLAGLLRVRGFTQNDAHIYCTKEQIEEEFLKVMKLHEEYYKIFGIKDYYMRLSLHDPKNKDKYIDMPQMWKFSEDAIRSAMKKSGLPYEEVVGEAAFYGPKIDFQIKSVVGREESASTNQLDFVACERFGLRYADNEGKEEKPFVIHRAPLGSHERFIAFLIEHYAGAFPLWLSPIQVAILPITDRVNDFAQGVYQQLFDAGIRAELDTSSETLGKKIRAWEMQKAPYIAVIGEKERSSGELAIRKRHKGNVGNKKISEFIDELKQAIDKRLSDEV